MEVNIELLKEWRDDAKSALKKEIGCLESKHGLLSSYMGVLDAVDELISENDDLREDLERKQSEIDDLSEQLRQAEAENTSLRMQMLSETGDLRQQLVEAPSRHRMHTHSLTLRYSNPLPPYCTAKQPHHSIPVPPRG